MWQSCHRKDDNYSYIIPRHYYKEEEEEKEFQFLPPPAEFKDYHDYWQSLPDELDQPKKWQHEEQQKEWQQDNNEEEQEDIIKWISQCIK